MNTVYGKILVSAIIIVALCLSCGYADTKVSGGMDWSFLGGSSSYEDDYDEDVIAKKGSKGNEVKLIQEKLIELGFLDDKADGVFGNRTREAVMDFQKANGFKETGKVTQEEYDVLFQPEPTSTPVPTPEPTPAPTAYIDSDGWCVSGDNMVGVKVVSFEETTYPEYELTFIFRLDGLTESDKWIYSYDIGKFATQFIADNPQFKNRKIKATLDDEAISIELQNETVYKVKTGIILGNKEKYTLSSTVDLTEVFPDDFINYDALNVATCINAYKKLMLDPSSLKVRSVYVETSDKFNIHGDYKYYVFTITGANKIGGLAEKTIVARFDPATGRYDLVDADTSDLIIANIGTYKSDFAYDMIDLSLGRGNLSKISLSAIDGYIK